MTFICLDGVGRLVVASPKEIRHGEIPNGPDDQEDGETDDQPRHYYKRFHFDWSAVLRGPQNATKLLPKSQRSRAD
jgi:hypothetical protein